MTKVWILVSRCAVAVFWILFGFFTVPWLFLMYILLEIHPELIKDLTLFAICYWILLKLDPRATAFKSYKDCGV
jgi:hypothetical protein